MTSYSVLRSAQRAIVIATWPGAWSDHSANITTLADGEQAAYLASALTRISEDAWDAAAFLDASPALELGISALIEQLRGPADKIEPVACPATAAGTPASGASPTRRKCWRQMRRPR